jgi:hypothetical protein
MPDLILHQPLMPSKVGERLSRFLRERQTAVQTPGSRHYRPRVRQRTSGPQGPAGGGQ